MTTFEMFKRDIEDLGLNLHIGAKNDWVALGRLLIVQLLEDEYIELSTIEQVADWRYRRLKYYLDRLYAGSYEWSEAVVF
ncbi:hypothetical protein [Globicatella sanguinis]|uniref:hypothetical protein n=1 Tax=Globicatella sanguinis TaxID=13076 RepID=UPI0008243576|nr:hypothetical protein [Globicatella sanguinis]